MHSITNKEIFSSLKSHRIALCGILNIKWRQDDVNNHFNKYINATHSLSAFSLVWGSPENIGKVLGLWYVSEIGCGLNTLYILSCWEYPFPLPLNHNEEWISECLVSACFGRRSVLCPLSYIKQYKARPFIPKDLPD